MSTLRKENQIFTFKFIYIYRYTNSIYVYYIYDLKRLEYRPGNFMLGKLCRPLSGLITSYVYMADIFGSSPVKQPLACAP